MGRPTRRIAGTSCTGGYVMNYNDFLHTKVEVAPVSGFDLLEQEVV